MYHGRQGGGSRAVRSPTSFARRPAGVPAQQLLAARQLNAMKVAVPKETFPGENRVALVPAHLATLKKAGLEVLVQRGAGVAAGFPDQQYEQQGAILVDSRAQAIGQADIVATVRAFGGNVGAEAD